MKIKKGHWILVFVFLVFFHLSPGVAKAYEPVFNRTLGGSVFGSIQLVDTTPLVDPGIGGGAFFDYRFNHRYSIALEAFVILQDGRGTSAGEGSLNFFGMPTSTIKMYFLNNTTVIDPYFGIGLGLYMLTEGSISNNTFGIGIGAQIEVGVDFNVTDNLLFSVGGAYRSVGLINSFSGPANASTFMPYTLFGRIGYRF